jgi:hypothetical protein
MGEEQRESPTIDHDLLGTFVPLDRLESRSVRVQESPSR